MNVHAIDTRRYTNINFRRLKGESTYMSTHTTCGLKLKDIKVCYAHMHADVHTQVLKKESVCNIIMRTHVKGLPIPKLIRTIATEYSPINA